LQQNTVWARFALMSPSQLPRFAPTIPHELAPLRNSIGA
jgi:hypothetical protein